MNKLIVISAPSGAGKTTIVREIMKDEKLRLKFSVSATNRQPRQNEINGKDYYFLDTEEFKQKIKNNEFVEWQEVYKNQFYGTLKSEIERIFKNNYNVIFDVDVLGGINIKKQYPDITCSIFIKPPSIEELEKRLLNRGTEDYDSIKKRIAKAKYEISLADKFDKIVVNDKLEDAVNEVHKIISDFIHFNQI